MKRVRLLGLAALAATVLIAWQNKANEMPWRTLEGKADGEAIQQAVDEILAEARDRNVPIMIYVGDAL